MVQFVIGSGQSGAVSGPGMEGGNQTINTHVKVWVSDHWEVARPGQPPFSTEGGNDPYNNVLWNACKKLQEDTGEDVYFVLSGKGGTPISEWAPGELQWNRLDNAVTGAMASPELAGKTVADYFLWYHGGSDSGNPHYTADFLDLRNRMVSEGFIASDTITVAGEHLLPGRANEAMLELILSGTAPWLRMAYDDDLEWVGRHPTGASCVEYGRRWFEASQQIAGEIGGKFVGYDNFDFGNKGDNLLYGIDDTFVWAGKGEDRIWASGDNVLLRGDEDDDVFIVSDFGDMTIRGGTGYDKVHIHMAPGENYDSLNLISVEFVKTYYDL